MRADRACDLLANRVQQKCQDEYDYVNVIPTHRFVTLILLGDSLCPALKKQVAIF